MNPAESVYAAKQSCIENMASADNRRYIGGLSEDMVSAPTIRNEIPGQLVELEMAVDAISKAAEAIMSKLDPILAKGHAGSVGRENPIPNRQSQLAVKMQELEMRLRSIAGQLNNTTERVQL